MLTLVERMGPWAIGVFRIVVGLLFFCHGTSTLLAWPVEPYGGATATLGQWPSWWAGIIQLVGGALIMAGLGTRVAAFLGSGSMAVAYFWKHQGEGLLPIQNDGDSPALFCWALVLLVFIGPGRLALQDLLPRARRRREAATESPLPEADEQAAEPVPA